ncbi:unnamed protein product [Lota lota]
MKWGDMRDDGDDEDGWMWMDIVFPFKAPGEEALPAAGPTFTRLARGKGATLPPPARFHGKLLAPRGSRPTDGGNSTGRGLPFLQTPVPSSVDNACATAICLLANLRRLRTRMLILFLMGFLFPVDRKWLEPTDMHKGVSRK